MHTPARSDSTIKAGRLPGTTGYFLVPGSEFAVLVYTHYRPAHLDWDYWDEIRFFVTKAVSTVLNNEDDEDDDSDFDFYKNRRTRGPDLVPGVA